MEWIWEERKAKANLAKHGVSFDLAKRAFDDLWQLNEPDPHPDDDRWQTIGLVGTMTLFVVHTVIEFDRTARIISARKASTAERRRYEAGRH